MRMVGGPQNRHTLCNEADRVRRRKETNGMQHRASFRRKMEFAAGTHAWQLKRGETAFGKPVTMTGRQAFAKNADYEQKFWEDKRSGARLWRYFLVESFVRGEGA